MSQQQYRYHTVDTFETFDVKENVERQSEIIESTTSTRQDLLSFVINFICAFAEFYKTNNPPIIPKMISLLIYQYIDPPNTAILTEPQHPKISKKKKIWRFNHPTYIDQIDENLITVHGSRVYGTYVNIHGSWLYEERMLLYSLSMQILSLRFSNTFHEVIGVLTNKNIFLLQTTNYQIWLQFKNVSKIDEIIDGDTMIDRYTAAQIARNIIDDEVIINIKLIPWLIGSTKNKLLLNILLCSDPISSFAELFGIYESDPLIWRVYAANIKMMDVQSDHVNILYASVDIDDMMVKKTADTNFIITGGTLDNICCKLQSKDECDEWIRQFKTRRIYVTEQKNDIHPHQNKIGGNANCDCCLL